MGKANVEKVITDKIRLSHKLDLRLRITTKVKLVQSQVSTKSS